MRVLIVDDERPARVKLRRMLASEPDVEVAGEAEDGPGAVEAIRRLAPDVVFLDIQMPVVDGFGVIDAVGAGAMPAVVFVTAYDEHALRAFEVQAVDYLLKPVAPERLRTVVARLRRQRAEGAEVTLRIAELMEAMHRPAYLQHLLVWRNERAHLLPVGGIDWLEADRNAIRAHAGGVHVVRGTLSELEARLDPARFLRVSRSHIVRLDAVKELQPWFHGDYRLVMRDGAELMWSRRYRARSRHAFELPRR